ncbi:MAG: type II toxin-antitoxin system RelE/ParE family toxin [Hyphomicrobiales bacterium]|nr:type II toxin-antitoxin system RelE/ParE family toxin [Hyphomicrobiales bacterium]MBV8826199.1 type II toxin-antitoxin system RelE/ParE family toxin [Hyphomicrobiales bacterium]MBV9427635.1 type II toxin-antitoxin system RelE/ParE family toxin [Bradyrhizobiaceae bacterium]
MPAQRWRVRLGAHAERDLLSILHWTAENFGAQQAKNYRTTLVQSMHELAVGPDVPGARKRDELGKGLYTLHVARHGRRGRHLLLFRAEAKRNIEIVRILHDSMDLRRHLSDLGLEEDT